MNTEAQPGAETLTESDDVRADVMAAFAQHTTDAPDTEQAAAEPEPAQTHERARNERGQFIQADGSVDPDQTAKPASDADKPVENIAQPSTAAEPPTSWSADAKAEWSKLSPATQQAVIKRESEISEGGRRWSDERKSYDEMLTPVRAAAQRAGVDEREGLNRLIAANDFLERDPQNAVRWLAQTYGVDLSKPASAAPQQPSDPRVNQLHQTVDQLQQRIDGRDQADLQQTINQFAAAPGHEHFEAVKADMGRMLTAGLAKDMQDAYDKAVWASPELRTKLIADQNASATAARQAAEKATADKARRGAISGTGSPSGGPASAPAFQGETVEDAVRAAFAQHRA